MIPLNVIVDRLLVDISNNTLHDILLSMTKTMSFPYYLLIAGFEQDIIYSINHLIMYSIGNNNSIEKIQILNSYSIMMIIMISKEI
jgi:hypothetical protein